MERYRATRVLFVSKSTLRQHSEKVAPISNEQRLPYTTRCPPFDPTVVSSCPTNSPEKPCTMNTAHPQPSSFSIANGTSIEGHALKASAVESKKTCPQWLLPLLVAVLALVALGTLGITIYLLMIVTMTTTTATSTLTTITQTTTGTTAISTPSQCSTATVISDGTRNIGYSGINYTCDMSGPLAVAGWYRFAGVGGTMLANHSVASYMCGTHATGWYTGALPSSVGTTVTGTVCYNFNNNTCNWSNAVSVISCNGYYVYNLSPPTICQLRYCTM